MPIELELTTNPSIKEWARPYDKMPDRLQVAITKALGSAGEEIKLEALLAPKRDGRAAKGKPVWRGKLVASITTQVRGNVAKVGPNSSIAPYGADIEFGTKSTTVEFSKLLLWAKSKGIEQFAGAIFRKLKDKGIKANPFLARAFRKAKKEVDRRFVIALKRALRPRDEKGRFI